MCKLIERYGVDDLNGWLLKFIPYVRKDKNERPIHRNPVLELTEFPVEKKIRGPITGCTSDMLPTGLASAPVTVTDTVNGTAEQLQFVAGLAGVTQAEDLSLRPLVGWGIAEGARIDNKLIARLRTEHAVEPASGLDTKHLLEVFEGNLPADLWRFYSETNGVWIEGKDALGKFSCSIYAAPRVRPALVLDTMRRELDFWTQQGLLTKKRCTERLDSMGPYAGLRVFAEAASSGSSFTRHLYLFGEDPQHWATLGAKPSRGVIFRWNGELTPEAFEPVAQTFTDWLEAMLARFALKNK